MRSWDNIEINDYIYLLIWHKNRYVEIRRCKVTRIKNLTNEYIKIWYTHPLNRNNDFLKLEERSLLVKKYQCVESQEWKIKKFKSLLITEFNEDIINTFENLHEV